MQVEPHVDDINFNLKMSENSTFIPKKTVSRTSKTLVRRHIPEAQPRGTLPTVGVLRESGPRVLGLSPSTARPGSLGRNSSSLATGKTSLTTSTARRGIVTSGRVHSSAAPPSLTTDPARARTSAVADAGSGVRARLKLAGRGGRISVTTSTALRVRTEGLNTSSLQKGQ